MKKKSYSEKLLDPRWQKRRLEILQSRGFECESCGSKTDTLHVHHCFYERGLNPWEYPDFSFKCLCADCHNSRACVELSIQRIISNLSEQELGILQGDILYAITMHGIKKVSAYCRRLGA